MVPLVLTHSHLSLPHLPRGAEIIRILNQLKTSKACGWVDWSRATGAWWRESQWACGGLNEFDPDVVVRVRVPKLHHEF